MGAWHIRGEAKQIGPVDYDGVIWRWWLEGERERPIHVKVSGTAVGSAPTVLPPRTAGAIETLGKSEVERVLDWAEPPRAIELSSGSAEPLRVGGDRGNVGPELVAILDRFEEQGVEVVFMPLDPASPTAGTEVSLTDWGGHEVLDGFKGHSLVEAARAAWEWWQENRDPRPAEVEPEQPAGDSDDTDAVFPEPGSTIDLSVPRLDITEFRTHGFRIVWTEWGTKEDPVWKVDVYTDSGEWVDSGLGDDREDAILGVAERLLPPDHQ